MSIFEEMRRDFERAKSTGNELIFFIFWGWVWFAWIGIAAFLASLVFLPLL